MLIEIAQSPLARLYISTRLRLPQSWLRSGEEKTVTGIDVMVG